MRKRHRLDLHPFLVSPGKPIQLKAHDPGFTAGFKNKSEAAEALIEDVSDLATAQELLWASNAYAVIVVLQGLDAAGKDGTIKHVLSGVNPQGVEVHSFREPTDEERSHHFLWRAMQRTPARGRIAIFNRSHYEEVLVVRVHPELLKKEWIPRQKPGELKELWKSRYRDINAWEEISARNNIILIKCFLNISKNEQRERLLERLNTPEKNWKFSATDLRERHFWDEYMHAYEQMLNATSTESAPWYVIPADKKWFTRACVAEVITSRIETLDLKYPQASDEERKALEEAKKRLEQETDD